MALTDPLPPILALDEEPLTPDEVDDLAEADDGELATERWTVEDDGGAEWAMRYLAEVAARRRQLRDQRDDWMDRIAHWFDQADRPLARRADLFEGWLKDYGRRQRDEGRKTIPLPSGSISSRPIKAKVEILDEAAILDALPEGVRALVVKETVRLSELQKLSQISRVTTYRCTYTCGHVVEFIEPTEVGEVLPCLECAPPLGASTSVVAEVGIVEAPVAVLTDDPTWPIPGTAISPEGVNVTVKPS